MFKHGKINDLNDFFVELKDRKEKNVYFYRINGYSDKIKSFISEYYTAARSFGIVLEGKIPNPDEKNLSYYEEMMGTGFQLSMGFITASLKKWLPRMNEYQNNNVAGSIYDTINDLKLEGKNENMQKNAYIKFMCWLYYKFERIITQLGENRIPKILYEGEISNYELKILTILSNAGCDVVLLQYNGDAKYLTLDKNSSLSFDLQIPGMGKFPPSFSIKELREEANKARERERLYGRMPETLNCTNAWIEGKWMEDIKKSILLRGNDKKLFYNCFYRINGVEDKLTYLDDLYQLQFELKNGDRHVVISENVIEPPTMDEISEIHRNNYKDVNQMILELSKNISGIGNEELQRLINKSFIDIILEAANEEGINMNKLVNKAVYLLCWIKRYRKELFPSWKMPEVSCFIYLGGCKNDNEALFLKMLARLPVDVVILKPDLNTKCCLEDKLLYEINYNFAMTVDKYPSENSEVRMGTVAYHAERELDTIMYQDSGIYRNQQYVKGTSISLETMYEEISILWNQELKYRPHFSVVNDTVNMPVIFSKISGVKENTVQQYWANIKSLKNEDTLVVTKAPYINPTDPNPIKAHVAEFYKNKRLQKNKIKNHQTYQYGFLREEIQDFILDKLQLLIDQKLIKGTFENGTEYTIISTVLNMDKETLRLIQKFDFTKKNPKLIYINTTEEIISLEDSILIAFLNLVGFDIIFFIPTGYLTVEKYFNKKIMEEHQVGEYMYDLHVPDLDSVSTSSGIRLPWHTRIFKRER